MLLKVIEFNELQKSAIGRLTGAGGVVEFVLVSKSPLAVETESHRVAALLALRELQKNQDLFLDDLLKRPEYKDKNKGDYFGITIDESALVGEKISITQFLGRLFCLETGRVLSRGQTSQFLNSYFWYGETEKPANVVDHMAVLYGKYSGFSDAFFEPPYGLSGTLKEKVETFADVVELLFGGFKEPAEVWMWSDDCSNYFDSGKEWWGTYFYTFSIVNSSTILAVLASTTD